MRWATACASAYLAHICLLASFFLSLICCGGQGLTMYSWLLWNSLWRAGWSWTHRDPLTYLRILSAGIKYMCQHCPVKTLKVLESNSIVKVRPSWFYCISFMVELRLFIYIFFFLWSWMLTFACKHDCCLGRLQQWGFWHSLENLGIFFQISSAFFQCRAVFLRALGCSGHYDFSRWDIYHCFNEHLFYVSLIVVLFFQISLSYSYS